MMNLRRGLLLDRDGVINVDRAYVCKREQFEFLPGLFPFLRAAQDLGFRLVVVTNQSGVARGLYTVDDYEKLTAWMLKELSTQGVAVDLVLACFEHAEGTIPAFTRESYWRKPNPGMILEAALRVSLDLKRSAFLGDNLRDMQAGQAAGVGTCLYLAQDGKDGPAGVKKVKNLNEAMDILKDL
jgi:D-glycero-D-manno-heptose 1,7-bisphosphate phosphatase